MLKVIGLALSLAGICATGAQADTCSRRPDQITSPAPQPPDLTAPDPRGRNFEFYTHSYALIIGESLYRNKSHLNDVPPEMGRLKAALETHKFLVSTYFNLGSDSLGPVIDCFMKSVSDDEQARVVLYFAGHGTKRTENGREVGYVLPIDIPADKFASDFKKKALPLSQFVEWARQLGVKHSLFIFDSCFSGSIVGTRGDKNENLQPSNFVFSDRVQLPLRQFLASGSPEEEVPAESTFLDVLVQSLLGQRPEADQNKDGYLTGKELESFLEGFVPQLEPHQTPMGGPIKDQNLDLGEIVFRLPPLEKQIARRPNPSPVPQGPTLQPLFRGTSEKGGTIGRLYQEEQYLTTSVPNCAGNCDPSKKKNYHIELKVAPVLPKMAVFSEPTLVCVNCTSAFAILSEPRLSPDRRTASVDIASWERSATWTLRATVLVPETSSVSAMLVNSVTNKVQTVSVNSLSVAGPSPTLAPDILAGLDKTLLALQAVDTATRRGARVQLAGYIAADNGSVTTQLVRGITSGTYFYQLGVTQALAKAANGWKTNESVSRDILLRAKRHTKDPTLLMSIDAALRNIRFSVYYETGSDRWLTRAGQLRPPQTTHPPLPDYRSLKPGDVLLAASEVYQRAGPSVAAGVLGVLPTDACVRIVAKEPGPARSVSTNFGWLQVVSVACAP